MKIGLLPLYLALYDEHAPAARPRLEAFYASVAERLERAGDIVIRTPFCRLAEEFSATVATLEAEGADVLMTLHMAYSPSLECIDALTATTLPIVVLDVTETLAFGPDTVREGDVRLPCCSHPDYAPSENQLALYKEAIK